MTFSQAIESLGSKKAEHIAKKYALLLGLDWNGGVGAVFAICLKDRDRRPSMGRQSDTADMAIERWVSKYSNGYARRPSVSTGKPTQTFPDEIIDEIISARLNDPPKDQISLIKYAHRLSMAAENILGQYLEEYISERLKQYGWYCAWGNTLSSVDMCNKNGKLIQIKNRSNTENSSSVKVRAGTKIEKWFRVDAASGDYLWGELQHLTGANNLTEADFKKFVIDSIKANPNCMALEDKSPWKAIIQK
jgi:hypothetical protein